MRKKILVIVLIVLVIFAGFRFLRKKPAPSGRRKTTSDSLKTSRSGKQKGKTAGQIKPKTKKELAEERKQARLEAKRRKAEERRRRREEARLRKLNKQKRKRGKKTIQLYKLTAIITVGSENYALIDSKRYGKYDDVMGRKILNILNDRIVIDEFGRTREIKIGESVIPQTVIPKTR